MRFLGISTIVGRSAVPALLGAALLSAALIPIQPAPVAAGEPYDIIRAEGHAYDGRDLFPVDEEIVPDPIPTPNPTPTPDPTPAPNLGSARSFKTYKDDNGAVVRWNPCRKIHYRVNTRYAPAGALADVKKAVGIVEAATGLDFVYGGTTTVIPQKSYGANSTPTYAPPLVIAWARRGTGAGTSNMLPGGGALAVGGWYGIGWTDSYGKKHRLRAVTGYVVIDSVTNSMPGGFATRPGGARGGVLLHELGHAMGLAHVSDPTQEMNPTVIDRSSYGNGDRAGLVKVGAGSGCIP